MLYRMRDYFNRKKLDNAQKMILRTPAVFCDNNAGFSLVSLVRKSDTLMYLAALKSFSRYLPPAHVYVVDDGTLDRDAKAMLQQHVSCLTILDNERFRSEKYPRGGCWERLSALVEISANGYVIQLDTDTLTLSSIDHVAEAVKSSKPFTLGSAQGTELIDADAASRIAENFLRDGDTHVQSLAESKLAAVDDGLSLRYVRGCAAFTGIPAGRLNKGDVERWSQRFAALVGARWEEWGTEQFMSNFLVANLDDAMVLPHPKYATCPESVSSNNAFIHFAGYCRFSGRVYRDLSRKVVNDMLPLLGK